MNSRGGMLHATPAASEGVIDTRGIVPPAIPRYFFSKIYLLNNLDSKNLFPALLLIIYLTSTRDTKVEIT